MSTKENHIRGQIRQAPESFLGQGEIAEINQHGLDQRRRGFLRQGLVAAASGAIGTGIAGLSAPAFGATDGDPAILEKQVWQTTLGKNVATMPYGLSLIHI